MLVYRLCISLLPTCIILHLIGLSQFNTRWSVSSPVLTHLLRDYVRFFWFRHLSHVCAVFVVIVYQCKWLSGKTGLRNDIVLQFVDVDVKSDSLTSNHSTVRSQFKEDTGEPAVSFQETNPIDQWLNWDLNAGPAAVQTSLTIRPQRRTLRSCTPEGETRTAWDVAHSTRRWGGFPPRSAATNTS